MREAHIRPAELLNEYLRLSAEDAARFFPSREDMIGRDCPGCGAREPAPAFTKNGFNYVRCRQCFTLYTDPAPAPGPLADFYRDSPSQKYWAEVFFPAVAEARREKIFRPRVKRIIELLRGLGPLPKRTVDVGAGAGIFLEECRSVGFGGRLSAVEPNGHLAKLCRGRGFETYEGFASEAAGDGEWAGKAGLVVSFEVIEHVTSALDFVGELAALAEPGGLILMTGLSGDGFDILALGEKSKAVSPPHHLNFLSRRGVKVLLERAGLKEAAFFTPGELDVDITLNAMKEDPEAVRDPFLRYLLTMAGDKARLAFQAFLTANDLSSHMWIVARR